MPEDLIPARSTSSAAQAELPTAEAPAIDIPQRSWQRNRTLHLATLATFGTFVAMGISPVYPNIADDLHVSSGVLGAIVGVSSAMSALVQIPCGLLADRGRTRLLMVIGLALPALALVLWGLSPNPVVFALGYAALGIGLPGMQAGAITAVIRTVPVHVRGRAMSWIWASSSVSNGAALVLFGVAGSSWRPAMFLAAAVPILCLLVVRLLWREQEENPTAPRDRLRLGLAWTFITQRTVWPIICVTTLMTATGVGLPIMVPFILSDQGYDAATVSGVMLAYLVGGAVGSPPVASATDRFGPARPLGVLMTLIGACFVLTAVTRPGPVGYAIVLFAAGGVLFGGQAAVQGLAAGAAQESTIGVGTALASLRVISFIGSSVVAPLVGWLIDLGPAVAEGFVAASSVLAAILAVVLLGASRTERHAVAIEPPG